MPSRSEFVLRKAGPADAAAIHALILRSIREVCGKDYPRDAIELWCAHRSADKILAWIADSDGYFLVAVESDRIIGAALRQNPDRIKLCYALPEYLGRGLGRSLMEALERQARERGVERLVLSSTVTAKGFYVRRGYIVEREELALDCIQHYVMSKRLM